MPKLKVKILGARNLPDLDVVGKVDVYCTAAIGNITHRTQTVSNTLSPRWSQEVVFNVPQIRSQKKVSPKKDGSPENPDSANEEEKEQEKETANGKESNEPPQEPGEDSHKYIVKIRLWNENTFTEEAMGKVDVPYHDLLRNIWRTRWYPCTSSRFPETQAEVQVGLYALDFGKYPQKEAPFHTTPPKQSPKRSPVSRQPREVEFTPDEAFRQACENTATDPSELQAKNIEFFRQQKGPDGQPVPEEVCQHRFDLHQTQRIKKLHAVLVERQRLLDRAKKSKAPHPPPAKEAVGEQEATEQELERALVPQPPVADKLLQRARRQKAFWDKNHENQAKAKKLREEKRQELLERIKTTAEREREEREKTFFSMLALHKSNQELMKQRWMRDDELAELRQNRLNTEYWERVSKYTKTHSSILDARTRRQKHLQEEVSRMDDAENTAARLAKARKVREEQDEEVRARTQKELEKNAQLCHEHMYKQFLMQAELANRSLRERQASEEVINRAYEIEQAHIRKTHASVSQWETKAKEIQNQQGAKTQSARKEKQAKREEAHRRAMSARISKVQSRSEQLQQLEERIEAQNQERERRLLIDKMIKLEDSKMASEHHDAVLRRVARTEEVRQREKQEKLNEQLKHAQERLDHVAKIRAVLV